MRWSEAQLISLLEPLYEASLRPAHWKIFLKKLSSEAGAVNATFFHHSHIHRRQQFKVVTNLQADAIAAGGSCA